MADYLDFGRFFGGLRSYLSILERHRNHTNRFLGEAFNVFDFIGYDENNLSDVVAKLLDPAGGHGQGTALLSCLLERSAAKAACAGADNAFARIAGAIRGQERVRTRREHGTSGGRFIDIVVDVGMFRLAIENKPRAGDEEKQVSDYIDHLKHSVGENWAFIYLNGYGARPSTSSLNAELRLELSEADRKIG